MHLTRKMDEDKQSLLRQLHSTDPEVRALATQKLWLLWFGAAGAEVEQVLIETEQLVAAGRYDEAEAALSEVIRLYPDFAEGWNRRATLRYLRHAYAESLEDCYQVVRLEPEHFGAWHGMGLCFMALRDFPKAAQAFRRALEIQPFAEANQDLLATCLEKLN